MSFLRPDEEEQRPKRPRLSFALTHSGSGGIPLIRPAGGPKRALAETHVCEFCAIFWRGSVKLGLLNSYVDAAIHVVIELNGNGLCHE